MAAREIVGVRDEIFAVTQNLVTTEPNVDAIITEGGMYVYEWKPVAPEALSPRIDLPLIRMSHSLSDSRSRVVGVKVFLTEEDMGMNFDIHDQADYDSDPFAPDFIQALQAYELHDHDICMSAFSALKQVEAEQAARQARENGEPKEEPFIFTDKRRVKL